MENENKQVCLTDKYICTGNKVNKKAVNMANSDSNYNPNGQGARLARIETEVDQIKGSIGILSESIQNLSHKIEVSNKTPWGIMISGASVLLVIIGVLFSPYIGQQSTNTSDIAKIMETRFSSEHYELNARADSYKDELARMQITAEQEKNALRQQLEDERIKTRLRVIERKLDLPISEVTKP